MEEEEDLFLRSSSVSHIARCTTLASRVLFSRAYVYGYAVLIASNLALIVWIVTDLIQNSGQLKPVSSGWFIALEVFVNVALVGEVCVRGFAMRDSFFKHWTNRVDVVVVIFSVASLLFYFASSGMLEEAITTVIVVFRYAIQLLRLFYLIKK
jgi:Ion transport protein